MGHFPCERRTLPGHIFIFHSSSAVEQSAVNRSVVGSIPTCGAIFGELSERLKEHDWKSCRRGRHVSRVQIPCSPPLNRSVFSICLARPVGQVVKTPPFHGGNTGSNPVRVISYWRISSAGRAPALQAGGRRFDPVILHHHLFMPA